MLTLSGTKFSVENFQPEEEMVSHVFCLSTNENLPNPLRENKAYIISTNKTFIPDGFKYYISFDEKTVLPDKRLIVLPPFYDYIQDGDVLRVNSFRKSVRVLYRRNSSHNFFLVTEQCNNYCLMCSQPPKDVDDSWLIEDLINAIPLIDPDTTAIGFTGGEPTLLGERFLKLLHLTKNYLPRTAIHILSNGRNFKDEAFTRQYASINHSDMMVGIPLYSDVSSIHDYVVQAKGAYDETIRGILNLKKMGQKVEIRIVLHKQTISRLPQLAEFISRNLVFVDHVALMGLEMTGFTKANLDELWIDPYDYQKQLCEAVGILKSFKMNVSIYNHQLCLLDKRLWPFAKKSISDWKNEYMPECESCQEKENCGGFFSSAVLRYSSKIAAFTGS